MSADWDEGWVRRKEPRPGPFKRYTGDHDALTDWIDQHGTFQGMHTIDDAKHSGQVEEFWYVNGQRVKLARGQYLVLEGLSFRAYDPDQMERFFDLAEGEE